MLLLVYIVEGEASSFYRKANRLSVEKIAVPSQPVAANWTKVTNKCQIAAWTFGFAHNFSVAQQKKTLIAYFSVSELKMDVDQCQASPVLGPAPLCDSSTQCISLSGSGFRPGGYICACRLGFYSPLALTNSSPQLSASLNSSHRCWRCPSSCDDRDCVLPLECVAPSNPALRTFVFTVQIVSMSITFAIGLIVYKNRKCKTIASGMWTIIELTLAGCIILYGTVLVRWFAPSTEMCIIEPWCREIGFVICYGAIILKLYRILIEFRTRKAHRWVVRDKDLLKYLLGMIIVVVGYMAAWTASNLDLIANEDYNIVTVGTMHTGYSFLTCKSVWWNYVTQLSELLILVFGIHLSYASRNAKSQFQERCFLCMAITVEAVVSAVFYVLRHIYWDSMSPDMALLGYFARSQATTTLVIILNLAPRWYYQQEISKWKVSRQYLTQESGRAPQEAFKPQDGLTATGSDIEREINLADMNPDDIREELKRLYTQLEVLKNKTLRFDNPHISKRRGGRKIAHRRFSLQNLKHQSTRGTVRHDVEPEPSRTPEDSVCSTEGPSIILNDGPSDIMASTPKKHVK